MNKILITGGSGLVGSYLREAMPQATFISSADFDLTNENDVKNLFDESWQRVIHLAAKVGGILENTTFPADFIEQNLLLNTLTLKHARLTGVSRFTAVLSASAHIDFGVNFPAADDTLDGWRADTNFPYAIAKRACAVQIDAINRQYGNRYNYLIPSNLYGVYDKFDDRKSHFLTALVGKIINSRRAGKKEILLFGTGRPIRQFLAARDLARIISCCVNEDITDSFNVAPDEIYSISEIARIALRACDADDFSVSYDGGAPDGQYRYDLSNEKLKKIIPEIRFTPLFDGIKELYEHNRKQ